MAIAVGRVYLPNLMRNVTVEVKIETSGARELCVRLWIARKLFQLAAMVLGCKVSVEL